MKDAFYKQHKLSLTIAKYELCLRGGLRQTADLC